MDSYHHYYGQEYTAVPVRRRRRRRRRQSIWPVVCLSVILAVLVGLAVRISVFGKIAHVEEGFDTTVPLHHHLTLPDTVTVQTLALPQGVAVEAHELVSGLEGTDITVSFVAEPSTEILGTQEVELLFTSGNALCKATAQLKRFHLVDRVSVDLDAEPATIRDFIPDGEVVAAFSGTAPEELHESGCGSYELTVECQGRKYPVTYRITESNPPKAVGSSVTTPAGVLPEAYTLVVDVVDESEVTVSYLKRPDVSQLGKQEVTVVLTDEFGNNNQVTATIEVVPNEDGPKFTGLDELRIQVGSTISYKSGVSCTDPQDGKLTFSVDPGNVDNKTVGTYTATYTATDADGHTLTVERTIIVQDEAAAAVEEYARKILSEIITDDMTRDQKIFKVYLYTKANVQFVGTSDKTSITHAAYEGFSTGKGDCYTYYAMNVVFLDMLGIENLEVARVGGTSNHWWNLVLHEDGKYYHVDACPKAIYLDGQTYYRLTDSDLDEYTYDEKVFAHRPNYYVYDKTLPEYQDIEIAQ